MVLNAVLLNRVVARGGLIVMSVLIMACAPNKFIKSEGFGAHGPVNGENIIVYSMLDLREPYLGVPLIQSIHNAIVSQLSAAKCKVVVTMFKDSRVGQNFSWSGQGLVPYPRFVEENAFRERSENITYRLLVIPAYTFDGGIYSYFDLNFMLWDIHQNRLIWKGVYRGNDMKLGGSLPYADELVAYLLKELKSKKLLLTP
ncbi:MAG: hypothetical protein U1F46_05895 [Marinagarivorans sp.]